MLSDHTIIGDSNVQPLRWRSAKRSHIYSHHGIDLQSMFPPTCSMWLYINKSITFILVLNTNTQ